MAKAKAKPDLSGELDPQTLAAMVLADLAQIEADADTHPDQDAANRIRSRVRRLRSIATGEQPEAEPDHG